MYRPKIDSKQMEQLYIISRKLKIPVTKLVRVAIQQYLIKYSDMLKEYETLTSAGSKITEQTGKRIEKKYAGIPRGVKTISTLGTPEEQASRYKEYRGGPAFKEKARSLAPLESTAIKLYTEKIIRSSSIW